MCRILSNLFISKHQKSHFLLKIVQDPQSNWVWWGLKVRDFRFRFAISSRPKLLFRFHFRMRLGRSIKFPWASRSLSECAWWRISQHRLLVDGLHTKTIPGTSRVHPAHMVEGWDLQSYNTSSLPLHSCGAFFSVRMIWRVVRS